jgi:uncharacterized protein YjbI with pentapeptide repeats
MNKEEKNSNKCPICGRPTHKESKYCIFHASAEEKTEEEFKQALKKYVNKIKKEDLDYKFKQFIFVGNINFKKDSNVTVFKNANFVGATFEENADFVGATFEGDAGFGEAIFEGDAWFRGATFKGNVDFSFATIEGSSIFDPANFKGNVDFSFATFKWDSFFARANFEGEAHFWAITFGQSAGFRGATFKKVTFFNRANFEGEADFGSTTFKENFYFEYATFKEDANFGIVHNKEYFQAITFEQYAGFERATFKGDANFIIKVLKKNIGFENALITQGKTLVIEITDVKNEVVINFKKICLENVYLELFLGEKTVIDFTKALIRSTVIKKSQIENHILQEEKKEFSEAQKIYLLLKNNFHSIGQYEDESWAFKKEKDMERLSQSFPYYKATLKNENKKESLPILKWIQKGNFKKWMTSAFSNMIYGYGEKPWNVIKTAVAIILIFALSFSFIGLGNPEIIELKGTAIHQNSGNMVDLISKGLLKNNVIRNFPDSLYFSTITFTTLGYGDFRPLEGLGRILAGSEAFLGAIMMALFVYTFARRTGGR